METTSHYKNDREYRARFIKNVIKDTNNVICVNILDRGHKNGPERFELTDKGIIKVYNNITNKHITDLIARPEQIYDRMGNAFLRLSNLIRKSVIMIAKMHQDLGYNEI